MVGPSPLISLLSRSSISIAVFTAPATKSGQEQQNTGTHQSANYVHSYLSQTHAN